jgi:hypothetical protein
MHSAGLALLVASGLLVIAAGIAAQWQFYGPTGRTDPWLLAVIASGLIGLLVALVLLALG